MNRLSVALLALAVGACRGKAPAPPEPAAPPAAAAPVAAEPAPAPPSEPQEVALTPGHIPKYISYEKDQIALIKASLEEFKKSTADASKKDQGVKETVQVLAASQRLQQRLDAEDAGLRAKAGLTNPEAEKLQKLVGDVASQRLMWRKTGQQSLTAMQANLDKQVQAAPADQREAMKAAMAEMTSNLTAMRDLRDLRKEYGDTLVDAVLQHEDEVVSLLEERYKMLGSVQ